MTYLLKGHRIYAFLRWVTGRQKQRYRLTKNCIGWRCELINHDPAIEGKRNEYPYLYSTPKYCFDK